MTLSRIFKWAAALLLATVLLAVTFILLFGWNWLRAPIEHETLDKTGRQLLIRGDLKLQLGWPSFQLSAGAVTFANPPWATEKQMVSADAMVIEIDMPRLLAGHVVLPEVHFKRPVIFLEQSRDGRKNWLLDMNQQDEGARIQVDRLMLDQGQLGYDDVRQNTHLQAELSTSHPDSEGAGLDFNAQGLYKGLPLKASGRGGPVLGLRDQITPYPLKANLSVGHTRVKVDGTITSLLEFSGMDLQLAVRGDNLAQLFPLLGIAFPATRAYVTEGHLLHSGKMWSYGRFSGRFGDSDVAGMLQIDTAGKRPVLKAKLHAKVLDVADLGPLIGARPGHLQVARKVASASASVNVLAPAQAHVLPDLPFNTVRWNSVDADVTLSAKTLRRAKELPLEDLVVHLSLHDSVLTLDPLNFGLAGGQLDTVISLDGRHDPIQAKAWVHVNQVQLGKLFPTINLTKTSVGQVNGEIDLVGSGNSVQRMLASSSGKVALVVNGGHVSKLMMEKVGLHLWEILALNLTGDRQVRLRCAVADFQVQAGVMRTNALIFDTEVTTIMGTGRIDLERETLDLTLKQKTKNTSPLALRSPIYIRGSFAKPVVEVDKVRLAARALGAITLGIINPLLTLLPLIDAGPGQDSDCAQLLRESKAAPVAGGRK